MEKLENIFQNIMKQITKLNSRVAVLEYDYRSKQNLFFIIGNGSFDFLSINVNNKKICSDKAYNLF